MNTRISSGQWFASSNQEVVRVISYKAPHVRYAQASYGGTVCKTTDRAFLEHYTPINEERATQLLKGPGQPPLPPKVTTIPDGVVEDSWFTPSPLKPSESWLQAKVQTKDKAKWVRAAQKLKQNLSQWVIETLNKAEK